VRGAPRLLVLAADVEQDVHDDVGQAVVLVENDRQAVGQDVALDRDAQRGGPLGRARWNGGEGEH